MKFYRIFDKIFILSLIIFSLCFSQMAIAEEKPAPIPSAEIKSSAVKPPVAESPAIAPLPDKLNRNTLGCVLPLSGQYADSGNKALDAILLSAGIFDEKNKTSREIIVEDSRGLPEATKAAIERLANTKNVMAIIAITGMAEAMDAASEANKWKVPLILITSKEGVTSAGEYVFQHFLTPTQQIRALAKYAIDDLNCAIFSILYPQDDYGEEMVKIFREEVARIGGKVEKAIPYSKKQTDFKEEINKLTDNIVHSAKKINADKNIPKDPIRVDFEALFIPDSGSRVKMITSQLAFYDIKDF
ncbi:MAG: penicillin-binding protein activator, partial [Deltaproteobacteria bacterium]|nr:penicillin-binding protein activator [Deltaproteobacteria bacterium]